MPSRTAHSILLFVSICFWPVSAMADSADYCAAFAKEAANLKTGQSAGAGSTDENWSRAYNQVFARCTQHYADEPSTRPEPARRSKARPSGKKAEIVKKAKVSKPARGRAKRSRAPAKGASLCRALKANVKGGYRIVNCKARR
jgi:hypothetical protein